MMTQPPPNTARHPFENLTGSPAAGARTARLSSGAGREPALPSYADVRAA